MHTHTSYKHRHLWSLALALLTWIPACADLSPAQTSDTTGATTQPSDTTDKETETTTDQSAESSLTTNSTDPTTTTDPSTSDGTGSESDTDPSTTDPSTTDPSTTDATTTDATTDTDTDTGVEGPSFEATVYPLIMNRCGCHISGAGMLVMANAGLAYAALVNVPAAQLNSMNRVTPGDLENSYLWHKIDATHLEVGGSGLMMPPGGKLMAPWLKIFSEWIEGGALP